MQPPVLSDQQTIECRQIGARLGELLHLVDDLVGELDRFGDQPGMGAPGGAVSTSCQQIALSRGPRPNK